MKKKAATKKATVRNNYKMLIDTKNPVAPGDGYLVEGLATPCALFKVKSVRQVKDVDYDAFEIKSIFIGQQLQWDDRRPIEEFWLGLNAPFTAWTTGLALMVSFRNKSDEPRRFALQLVGDLSVAPSRT
jgi:hypothetical protein